MSRAKAFKWQRPTPDAAEVRRLTGLVQQLANAHHIVGGREAKHFVNSCLAAVRFVGFIPPAHNFQDARLMAAMLADADTELVRTIVSITRHELLCGPLIPGVMPHGNTLHMKAIEDRSFIQPTRLEQAVVETAEWLLDQLKVALPAGSMSHLVRELPVHRRGMRLTVPNRETAAMLTRFVNFNSPHARQLMRALADAYARPLNPLPLLQVAANK